MTAGSSTWIAVAGFTASVLLFLLDLVISTMLLSVASLSRVALRRLIAESGSPLQYLEGIKTLSSTHRAALQTTRQLCLLGGSALSAVASKAAGWPRPWLFGVLCGAVVGVVLVETLFARYFALRDPKATIRATAFLVRPLHAVTYPFLGPIHRLLGRSAASVVQSEVEREEDTDEEVEAFIEVGEREGILEANEGEMVRGIMDLGETLVREIMVPRTDIVAFPSTMTVAEARRQLLHLPHSRVPVYRETIDNVVGILHVRDLLRAWEEGRDTGLITAYLKPAFFVPETRLVAELLAEMRLRTHIALVVDEYGGLAGLVTLEDLIEEIVGDIRDEHASEEPRLEQEADGAWLVSGVAHVEEIEELFGVEVSDRDFDTVGGLVVSRLGRVPEAGESFDLGTLRFEVVRADRRRVYRVRIRPIGTSEIAEAGVS